MVHTVIIVLVSAIVAAGVMLLFSPVAVRLTFSSAGWHAAGGGVLSFLHPSVLSVEMDFSGKIWRFRLLGRLWGKQKKTEPETRYSTGEDPSFGRKAQPESISIPEIEKTGAETVSSEAEETDRQPETAKETSAAPVASLKHPTVFPSPASPQKEEVLLTEKSVNSMVPEVIAGEETPKETNTTATEEKMAPEKKKMDNWFKRLENNRYLFFLRNVRWCSKVIRWLLRIISTLFRLVRFDRFQVAIRGGISDPVVTGSLTGLYRALLHGLPLRRPYVLSFEPVFMRNHFECEGSIRMGTSLARVLMPVGVAVVTFPWLHTIWLVWCVYRRERRYRKEQKLAV